MLIRFGVENHYSIRDYQEVSFVAAAYKEHGASLLKSAGFKEALLPVIVMYGANAAGKSNMIAAFSRLLGEVRNSFIGRKPDAQIRHTPFRLDSDSQAKPTRFDCDFILDEVRFHYGFLFDKTSIREEWLYAYPKGSRQVWFHRKPDERDEIYFGKELKGPNKEVEKLTRPNSLLMSAAAQGNHPTLSKLYDYFNQITVLRMSASEVNQGTIAEFMRNEAQREKILKYLQSADFGICDSRITSKPMDAEARAKLESIMKLMTDSAEVPMEDLEKFVTARVELGHAGADGKTWFLNFGDESTGTRQLLSILGPIVSALERGRPVILDEVTTGLHTLLSQRLISLFTSRETNPNKAQLIFSTHDTNLLSTKLIRRDEVWLVEKMRDGHSSVYPLSDIKTKSTDNIEKGYIQGRFGAIPLIGADKKMIATNRSAT